MQNGSGLGLGKSLKISQLDQSLFFGRQRGEAGGKIQARLGGRSCFRLRDRIFQTAFLVPGQRCVDRGDGGGQGQSQEDLFGRDL